ncbi:MAG: glycosyltransferase [Bacteroidota bacterium]
MLLLLPTACLFQLALWVSAAIGLKRIEEDQPLTDTPAPPLPLSVVVAAHNEADTLPVLLDALATQTHAPFEIIVVDDRSTDGTAEVAHPREGLDLHLVQITRAESEASGLPPKKYAVTRGIELAMHNRIVVTDADGRPPPTWLSTLARHAAPEGTDEGAVLVGYGPYSSARGWLNRFVRFETTQTAVWAAAGIGLGRPWQAVGRNLSYPKEVFERVGGFASSAASLSGDDDLFVQEVARHDAAPVRYVLDPDAAVASTAPSSWGAFWRQKRRHASAGTHYPMGVLVGLGLVHVSNLLLWLGAPLLHGLAGNPAGWGLLAAKLLIQFGVLRTFRDAMHTDGDLALALPVLDASSAIYHAVFAVLGLLPSPLRW